MRTVYLNGQFVPESQARLSIYDSALVTGDMAFEVTRTIHGRPYRLDEHIQRLFHGLAQLSIDPQLSPTKLAELSLEVLARNVPTEGPDMDWNIIHNVSRGPAGQFREAFPPEELRPTVAISCYPIAAKVAPFARAYDDGLDLVVPAQGAIPSAILDASIKSRSRLHLQLANLQASEMRPGAAAVLVAPDGYLTEGTSGNVFVVSGGRLVTPTTRDILPGITRGVVLQLAAKLGLDTAETDITPAMAASAEEIFITATSIGILHARSFEGRVVGDGRLGPVTARLRQALFDEVGLDFRAQARNYAAQFSV